MNSEDNKAEDNEVKEGQETSSQNQDQGFKVEDNEVL